MRLISLIVRFPYYGTLGAGWHLWVPDVHRTKRTMPYSTALKMPGRRGIGSLDARMPWHPPAPPSPTTALLMPGIS
jgi:hypothetical protein